MMARSTLRPIIALAHLTVILASIPDVQSAYFGKSLGRLSELHHAVSGEVYAVDARTLYIKDFTYDGQGPAAYFFAGNTRSPGTGGFRLKDEKGSGEVIRRYRKEGVTLTLPEGKTLNNIKWFSVWCEEFEVNFGDVKIPRNFDYPRPRKIDALKGIHGISSDNIVVVDAQTLLVPNLAYDGEAPDAKFWVGRGPKPSPQGIRVADENGKEIPLRRYVDKTVVLTLPGDLTVFDIGHFGIWCEAFTVDFGHIQVPHNLNVPPSLKMLGVSPQKRPRGFDISEVPRQRAQLVGGQLEATTFRPQQQFSRQFVQPLIAQHRSDNLTPTNQDSNRHELVNRAIYNQPSANSINQLQQNYHQPSANSINQLQSNYNQPSTNSISQLQPNYNQPQFQYNQFTQPQQQQQQQYQPQQQYLQQQQLLNQQKLLQQLLLTQQLQQHQSNQPVRYFPIVQPQQDQQQQHNQQQQQQLIQQQIFYNQLLNTRRLQEEQRSRDQYNKQFSFVGNSNNYISQG